MKKLFSLIFIFVSLSASAQQTVKSTFSTPDLRAFELKSHVKSMQWTGPTMEPVDDPELGKVEFSVAGDVTLSEFALTRARISITTPTSTSVRPPTNSSFVRRNS